MTRGAGPPALQGVGHRQLVPDVFTDIAAAHHPFLLLAAAIIWLCLRCHSVKILAGFENHLPHAMKYDTTPNTKNELFARTIKNKLVARSVNVNKSVQKRLVARINKLVSHTEQFMPKRVQQLSHAI